LALLVGSTRARAEEPAATPAAKTEAKAEKPAKAAECKAGQAHKCDKAQACCKAGKHTGVLEGQLVDLKCHLAMGMAGKGQTPCAVQCAKAGMPVGLEDAENGKVFTVLAAPAGLAALMGQKVRITGTQFSNAMAIAPEKIEVEKDGSWTEYKLPEAPM
jgi:hypothetical protein